MTKQPYRRDEGMTDLPDIPVVYTPDDSDGWMTCDVGIGVEEGRFDGSSMEVPITVVEVRIAETVDIPFKACYGARIAVEPGDLLRLAHWLTCEAVARTLAEPDQREGAYQAAGAAFARAFGPKPKKPA